jgi:hypothetical protein
MVYTVAGRIAVHSETGGGLELGIDEVDGKLLKDMIPTISQQITEASFKAADLDCDQRISYSEFVSWLESDSHTATEIRECFAFLHDSDTGINPV